MSHPIRTVAIVGAGTMGRGIAQACAAGGMSVLLYDQVPDVSGQAIRAIEASLTKQIEKAKMTAERAGEILRRLTPAKDLADLHADLVIEAVAEKLDVKREVLLRVEEANTTDCLLATNTSSLPVSDIASALRRPDRFAGLHFFNPAPVMKLVEVVRGKATTLHTVEALMAFCHHLGKQPVVVQDSPGFIVNRVARPFYLEALKAVEDGASTVDTVDELLRATGFRMGPFELMDLIGIDVNLAVTRSVYEAFGEPPRFKPSRLQEDKVRTGHLGRKSGVGFFAYGNRESGVGDR